MGEHWAAARLASGHIGVTAGSMPVTICRKTTTWTSSGWGRRGGDYVITLACRLDFVRSRGGRPTMIARVLKQGLGELPLDRHSCQLLGPTALVSPLPAEQVPGPTLRRSCRPSWACSPSSRSSTRDTAKPRSVRGRYGNPPIRSPAHSLSALRRLFDVSKQVFGSMFVHGLNVLVSDLGSNRSAGNACTFYFLHILLDTTLGESLWIPRINCTPDATRKVSD